MCVLSSLIFTAFAAISLYGSIAEHDNILLMLFSIVFAYLAIDNAIQAYLWFRDREEVKELYKLDAIGEAADNHELAQSIRSLFRRSPK